MADNVILRSGLCHIANEATEAISVPFRASLIARLFGGSAPFHIAWLVMAVVVDAIDGMLIAWPRPHIGKELLEGMAPLLADANSTPSVVFESRMRGILASADNSRPSLIFTRIGSSVRDGAVGRAFLLEASATLMRSSHEVVG